MLRGQSGLESDRLGINSDLVKPVDFEQVLRVVRQLGSYWLLLNPAPAPGTSVDTA